MSFAAYICRQHAYLISELGRLTKLDAKNTCKKRDAKTAVCPIKTNSRVYAIKKNPVLNCTQIKNDPRNAVIIHFVLVTKHIVVNAAYVCDRPRT